MGELTGIRESRLVCVCWNVSLIGFKCNIRQKNSMRVQQNQNSELLVSSWQKSATMVLV